MRNSNFPVKYLCVCLIAVYVLFCDFTVTAQTSGRDIYNEISSFKLTKGLALTGQTINKDRVTLSLTGTIYFSEPVAGKHTGAIFIGQGKFSAPVPDSSFEKANVRRLLKADIVESDFSSAVFRVSDGVLEELAAAAKPMSIPADAQKSALELDARIRKETGANIPSRLTTSIVNTEKEGVFFASFNGGKLNNFSFIFDPLTRIPTANFGLNAGEKGIIFRYNDGLFSTEDLMAFYSQSDYERKIVDYSDMNDLVDITGYDIEMDLRAPKSRIGVRSNIKMIAFAYDVTAIPFSLGESLGRYDDERLKKQLRVASVKFEGRQIEHIQEDWEGGFTVFLPTVVKQGQPFELEVVMEGDFLEQPDAAMGFSYPRSTTSWYPRHGYLDRAEYKFKFTHAKKYKVVCVGNRLSETPSPENKDLMITQYYMDHPISLATFALGPYQRHNEIVKWDGTEDTLPLEFNSISTMPVKEDFILAEMSNSIRYFKKLFGPYPYKTYSASFHPYGFGQGFPSMLMIPAADDANKNTYAFISHETAHQWWGNIVAWRSYRDQWLSEGFAEYSGVLYTGIRDSPKASVNLIENMRESLRRPPETLTGRGKGNLNDLGPIVQGHRLSTSKSFGGYQTLVYNKGALVLRMLHFLFTDPNTGNGDQFFAMMSDFVERYRNKSASSDDFRVVANEHFAKTPIAKRYGIKDLNWFFQQWVYETYLPKYSMDYSFEQQPDGSVLMIGNVYQENVPDGFFMPLPVSISFGGDKTASGIVAAIGPKTPFKIKLSSKPAKAELDPNKWILSESTSTK